MTYDQWKLDSGYDEEPEECWHEDYEIDILTGRAACDRCDHTWWATDAAIEARARHEREYAEYIAEQQHPWNRFKVWARSKWSLWRPRFPRKHIEADDDIPF